MIQVDTQVELAPLTWWKVGGPADFFCQPKSQSELEEALLWAKHNQKPVTVLGGGSNVLVSDRGIRGLVLSMRDLKAIEIKETPERLTVVCESGCLKAEVLKPFLKAKLAPALFLCGLPGDMGGGVVMNAGVSEKIVPREFFEIVDWFEVLDLDVNGKCQRRVFQKDQVQWHYRHSDGWQPGVITKLQVSWPNQSDENIPTLVKQATRNRIMKQPLNLPSCGSVFKNPPGNSSGALIEQSGLKGYRLGDAQVSEKHANFIVNLGKARASDILTVIRHVQAEVKKKFAIELVPEVKLLGDWDREAHNQGEK